jgi:cytochrome c553
MIMAIDRVRGAHKFVLLLGLSLSACSAEPADGEHPGVESPPPVAGAAGVFGTSPGVAGSFAPSGGFAVPGSFPVAVAPPGTDVSFAAGSSSPAPPILGGPVIRAESAPPPISGGTMLATRDGQWLVAADPDRDRVYFVDLKTRALSHVRELDAGDEPGRLVEDTAGRIHVALRGGHAIASLPREADGAITRREVCDLPRGVAYDAARDRLAIACAEGKLVLLPAAPEGAVSQTIELERGVRDVLVHGDEFQVTKFRSAELLRLDAKGSMITRRSPPAFSTFDFKSVDSSGVAMQQQVDSDPGTAWRMIDVPGRGTAVLHQRARGGEIQVQAGGYGAGQCGPGIVQSSLTIGLDGEHSVSADITDAALAVDMATDPDGVLLAIAAPGNWGSSPQVQVYPLVGQSVLSQLMAQANSSGSAGSAGPAGARAAAVGGNGVAANGGVAGFGGSFMPGNCIGPDRIIETPMGQATAVAFVSPYEVAVQEREPAAISILDVRTNQLSARVDLDQPTRFDTGHTMFHVRAGAGIACASCHAEAGDDAHVWTFHGIGARRTQTLRGGILGTEPLHWSGDMKDFPTLVREVFVGRMSGFNPSNEQTGAMSRWIDRQPAFTVHARDAAAADRGKELFASEAVGCASCHNGTHLTNNKSADVGTGAELQVPSLHGVSFRLPVMHDGCAKTLMQRFDGACGGGDKHGHTSQLAPSQLTDLVSYLETL